MNAAPEKSVFLNCPYDERYAPLFDALLFATVCCGFVPRSALESGAVAEPRIDRVVRTLFASRYSIHDLSRSRGEGAEGWARFNMPLELGIAMARRYVTRHRSERHDWLLLVADGHAFRRFISDLAGFDPETHEETVDTLLPKVIAWLANRTPVRTPTPAAVLATLPAFQARKAQLGADWKGAVPWKHVLVAAEEVAKEM
jgi:hypothetical protein